MLICQGNSSYFINMDEPSEHPQNLISSQDVQISKEITNLQHNPTQALKPTKVIFKKPTHKKPSFISLDAQQKFKRFKTHIQTGLPVDFKENEEVLEWFKNVGWECLVSFDDVSVYPNILCQFYANMIPVKDNNGNLLHIDTMVHNKHIRIDESLLVRSLRLNPAMLGLEKDNCYLKSYTKTIDSALHFRMQLSIACSTFLPPTKLSVPQSISPIYFSAKAQFLNRIIKANIMPHRFETLTEPQDLEIIYGLMTGNITFGLPYFLLTSIHSCFEKEFVGYGLLLNAVFSYLNIRLTNEKSQIVKGSITNARLFLPPRSLSLFDTSEIILTTEQNVTLQLEALHGVQSSIIENQQILHSNQLVLHKEIMHNQALLGNTITTLDMIKTQLDIIQQSSIFPPIIPNEAPIATNQDILPVRIEGFPEATHSSLNTAMNDLFTIPFLDPLPLQPLSSTDLEFI